MKLLTRAEAIQKGEKYFFTGKSCVSGHISKRSVSNYTCYQCQLEKTSKFRENNPEYHTSYNSSYVHPDPNRLRVIFKTTSARRRKDQKSQVDATHRAYRKRNVEKIRERTRQNMKKFPELYYTLNAKRRAAKLNAIPDWACLEKIKCVYDDCYTINTLSRMCGGTEKFVVDHIVPLQGNTVCGLHVDYNLQIVLNSYNAKKYNKLEE